MQWQEENIVDQVAEAIRKGTRSVDIIPLPIHSVDPIAECTKIVFPGMGCVHSIVAKGSVFYVEGKVYNKKISTAKPGALLSKKRVQKPDTKKRVMAVQKKFRNLAAVMRRGK